MKKDYMLVPCEIKSVKEDSGENMIIVEGYASFYNNIDLGGDRVLPSFFVDDLRENGNQRPALWQHNSSEPIGIKFYESDNNGLRFIAKMPMDDTFVMGRVYPQMRVGSVKAASIGYWTFEEKYNVVDKCNDLIKGALRESSFVTFPMNPKASVFSVRKQAKSIMSGNTKDMDDGVKSAVMDFIKSGEITLDSEVQSKSTNFTMYPFADEATKWDSNKSVSDIRANTGSEENPSKNYRKGFMYYDPENADKFGGYKLPYVYYMDGGFKIVPRAIYAIAGVLAGSRGGVNIPEGDKSAIKGYINRVYKKLGREEPFKSAGKFFVDKMTLKSMYPEDVEYILGNENVILSTGAKEVIVEALRSPVSEGSVSSDGDKLGKAFADLKKSFEGE